jgi:hypothetical protein
MSPEELEAARKLSSVFYHRNLTTEELQDALIDTIDHIYMQASQIAQLEKNCILTPDGKIFVPEGHPELVRLRDQVARLKEALVEERAKQVNFMSSNDQSIMREVWAHESVQKRLHMRDRAKRELDMEDILSEAL